MAAPGLPGADAQQPGAGRVMRGPVGAALRAAGAAAHGGGGGGVPGPPGSALGRPAQLRHTLSHTGPPGLRAAAPGERVAGAGDAGAAAGGAAPPTPPLPHLRPPALPHSPPCERPSLRTAFGGSRPPLAAPPWAAPARGGRGGPGGPGGRVGPEEAPASAGWLSCHRIRAMGPNWSLLVLTGGL